MYFAFYERFLFLNINGLDEAIKQCPEDELEVIVLLAASKYNTPQLLTSSNKMNTISSINEESINASS